MEQSPKKPKSPSSTNILWNEDEKERLPPRITPYSALMDSILEFWDDHKEVAPGFTNRVRRKKYLLDLFNNSQRPEEVLLTMFLTLDKKFVTDFFESVILPNEEMLKNFIEYLISNNNNEQNNIIKWIFKYYIDIVKFNFGRNRTYYDTAIMERNYDIIKYFESNGFEYTSSAFGAALFSNNELAMKHLIDLNILNASISGYLSTVTFLVHIGGLVPEDAITFANQDDSTRGGEELTNEMREFLTQARAIQQNTH